MELQPPSTQLVRRPDKGPRAKPVWTDVRIKHPTREDMPAYIYARDRSPTGGDPVYRYNVIYSPDTLTTNSTFLRVFEPLYWMPASGLLPEPPI